MDKDTAYKIWENYRNKLQHEKQDEEDLIEALIFLSDNGDPLATTYLGGTYYEMKKFDLAEKYYKIAADKGVVGAMNGLGYIYYYGRVGERDYEKAYKYYKMASDLGSIQDTIKLSDMYKNGYYVEKDVDKSYELLMRAYNNTNNDEENRFWHMPEIASRLATIKLNKGEIEEGINYLYSARSILINRIAYTGAFWGDLTIMEIIEANLFKYDETIKYDDCIYNLFELLKIEGEYRFICKKEVYVVSAIKDEDGIAIKFLDNWYKSAKDFFLKAKLKDKKITIEAKFSKLG